MTILKKKILSISPPADTFFVETDLKIHMDFQETHNRQTKAGKEQSKTYTSCFQNLLEQ